MAKFWKKSLNGHATVVGNHATVGWLSNNLISTLQQNWQNFEESHWTVTRQSSEVTRPSADCQSTLFRRVSKNGKIFKKSRNGHATVIGGHAIVKRQSNNFFSTFQPKWQNFEKSRRTVTRQSSEVTRPSADCQTTLFRRYSKNGKIFKKVAERSRNSRRRSRDRQPTVKQLFLDVSTKMADFWKKSLNGQATVIGGHTTVGWLSNNIISTLQQKWQNFQKSHWAVTRQSSEVTRPSADCQSTLFRHCSKNGKIFKKSLKGHVTVVGNHATVGRLSNNFFRRFNQNGKMLKKVAERSRDSRRMVTRPSADCQTILCRRFSKNGKIIKKSCWTVDSGWRSRDRRPTVKQPFLDVSIKMAKFGKKVAGRSADSRRRSRDRRLIVKQHYFDVTAKMAKFW